MHRSRYFMPLLRFDPFWMMGAMGAMGLSLRVLWPVLAVLGEKAVSPSPPEPDGPMAVQTDVACCGMLWALEMARMGVRMSKDV